MPKHILILILFLICTFYAENSPAQDYLQKFSGIPFTVNGQTSMAPFNGGVDNARTQFVDINNDGKPDLFTYDVDTTLNFYQNNGTTSVPKFDLVTTRYQNLSIKYWFAFADMDNDGDFDLFAGAEPSIIKYYRNTGTNTNPVYTLIISELRTNSDSTIFSESNSVPTFCDIDNDGDKDFFTGTALGRITFYENIGTPTNFNFKYITDFWQELEIISPVAKPFKLINENDGGTRHGANSIQFTDLDGDNDNDLFFGDLYSKSIYFIKNYGTPSNPVMAVADSAYPRPNPYYSFGFNSVRFCDYDGDGDNDLFVLGLYSAQTWKNMVYYKNVGTQFNPSFQFVSNNFLSNVDVGSNSNIVFADIDNDGKKDLFSGSAEQRIVYFKNAGTAVSPAFTLMTDSLPMNISPDNYYMAPSLADLDNDGDMDMILGSYITDSIWYYRNTGSSSNFIFTKIAVGNTIGITGVGQSSAPTIVDIDNDGDFDLLTGNSAGRINYYENTGTPVSFNFVLRSNFYFNIDVGNESVPRFTDVDSDGDKDLLIGTLGGNVVYYKNTGTSTSPNFVLETNNYANVKVYSNACPEFTDIDTDGDIDMFIANIKGGIYYFENRDIIGISNISTEVPAEFKLSQNYPNPFNGVSNIEFAIPSLSHVTLIIYDISGKEISLLHSGKLNAGVYKYQWDSGDLPSGIYLYSLRTENFSQTKKMVLIK
ncbi:MAG TPA: FG-GAP-like repeat-containing protein [Ignavibacteria bacterium]|nr:FG-GAP-like repeat-containing protein [Ignavibacteria bacterium]